MRPLGSMGSPWTPKEGLMLVLLQFFGNVGGDGFFGRFGLLLAARGNRRHGQEGKRPAHRHASGDQAS